MFEPAPLELRSRNVLDSRVPTPWSHPGSFRVTPHPCRPPKNHNQSRGKDRRKSSTVVTRNSSSNVEVSSVMRCEAINAPSTRLDLRLRRHEGRSKPGSFPFVAGPTHVRLPTRPIPLRLAVGYSLPRELFQFTIPPRALDSVPGPLQRALPRRRCAPSFFLLFHGRWSFSDTSKPASRDLWRRVYYRLDAMHRAEYFIARRMARIARPSSRRFQRISFVGEETTRHGESLDSNATTFLFRVVNTTD